MVNISNVSIRPSAPALEAMRIIDRGAAQIALVVVEQHRLLGVVSHHVDLQSSSWSRC